MSGDELTARLTKARFPRASKYDGRWLVENTMGPHPLWLAEYLAEAVPLAPGMRVLDLGCGKAISSIFFAMEFGVRVTAADLWVDPADNAGRIEAAGLSGQVTPVRAEAHALPFGEGEFDAIVSLDAYHYFGTDDLYLGTIAKFLEPGGTLGVVVPGLAREARSTRFRTPSSQVAMGILLLSLAGVVVASLGQDGHRDDRDRGLDARRPCPVAGMEPDRGAAGQRIPRPVLGGRDRDARSRRGRSLRVHASRGEEGLCRAAEAPGQAVRHDSRVSGWVIRPSGKRGCSSFVSKYGSRDEHQMCTVGCTSVGSSRLGIRMQTRSDPSGEGTAARW
jgi:SAM-dependent methyltransferase